MDRNGDGDGDDTILFLVDKATGAVTSQGVSTRASPYVHMSSVNAADAPFLFSSDGWLAFRTWEMDEGRDLDGDGASSATLLRFFRPSTGLMRSTHARPRHDLPLLAGFAGRYPVTSSRYDPVASECILDVVHLRP